MSNYQPIDFTYLGVRDSRHQCGHQSRKESSVRLPFTGLCCALDKQQYINYQPIDFTYLGLTVDITVDISHVKNQVLGCRLQDCVVH